MKTITIAAVLLMVSATAWADEPNKSQGYDLMNTNEPVVLSEEEMDGVTAAGNVTRHLDLTTQCWECTSGDADAYPRESLAFNYDKIVWR